MPNTPWQVDKRLGGLDEDLFALAELYLAFLAAQINFLVPDKRKIYQLGEELQEKSIGIIDAYGRKHQLRNGKEQLVRLPTGNVRISWESPELWDTNDHALHEDGNKLIEELGLISFTYEPTRAISSMPHSFSLKRIKQTNYRPSGFPKWWRPSIAERLFGSRGKAKYGAEELIGFNGWGLRRIYIYDDCNMEAYLMNSDNWLECDVPPRRTMRRKWQSCSYPRHFIDGESTAQVGPKVLSEDRARILADEKNRGYIRAHWKNVGRTIALLILGGITGAVAGICIDPN